LRTNTPTLKSRYKSRKDRNKKIKSCLITRLFWPWLPKPNPARPRPSLRPLALLTQLKGIQHK
jgi:hypothetical protein